MADELRYFLTAVGYFTRVPLPQRLAVWVGFEPHYLNAAARYPAVGLLVGVAGALVTGLAWQLWSPSVAIVLGMAATLLLTGAFHEDGLADCVDAFGGGYRPEDVLAIMHDSRVGAFGAIAIVVALLLSGNCWFPWARAGRRDAAGRAGGGAWRQPRDGDHVPGHA
jgi:adenosylcobinamide-GDP ribazoletransferase